MEKLETVINKFVGDVLISSGFIAYLGCFTVRLCHKFCSGKTISIYFLEVNRKDCFRNIFMK